MPKGHRAASSGLVRTHSRSSSSTRLQANLQITQREPPPLKHVEKSKKNGYSHEAHPKGTNAFGRVNSAQRIHSKEHVQPLVTKRVSHPDYKPNGAKPKAGFTISSPGDDDDDEWVSTESGAATPGHNDDSDSDDDTDAHPHAGHPPLHLSLQHPSEASHPGQDALQDASHLPRVDTARPSDYNAAVNLGSAQARTSGLPPVMDDRLPLQPQQTTDPSSAIPTHDVPSRPPSKASSTHPSRPRTNRPPSMHSIGGRSDHALRPHPLIRGHSFGHIQPPKPVPLAPLTVISDASTVSSESHTLPDDPYHQLSTSPASSLRTVGESPTSSNSASASQQQRRTSISSARSVATLPAHSTMRESNWSFSDRKRTTSTISHSSSSAALSSLVHLPAVTRPPSPQPISFFPPVNPHANIEGIHPLLPSPYLNNHLTVLARHTPIRESFDRVMRAKQMRA